jgi:hypothetical protein
MACVPAFPFSLADAIRQKRCRVFKFYDRLLRGKRVRVVIIEKITSKIQDWAVLILGFSVMLWSFLYSWGVPDLERDYWHWLAMSTPLLALFFLYAAISGGAFFLGSVTVTEDEITLADRIPKIQLSLSSITKCHVDDKTGDLIISCDKPKKYKVVRRRFSEGVLVVQEAVQKCRGAT